MCSHNIKNTQLCSDMRRIKRIHFVGIGGVGMSGIAEVLLNQGYQISGSDVNENQSTEQLKSLKAIIYKDHKPEHIEGAEVIVVSGAVNEDNPELIAAKAARIPIISRAEMLAELMRFRYGIAVAGTHGKTTTTSLVASILAEGGCDPTFVIGGRLNSAGSNARLGTGHYFVAEADESDASFLYLQPMIAVVTNIDHDHMSTYHHDFSQLRQTFLDFLHHLPFYGLAIVCVDDPVIRDLLSSIKRPVLTYGFHESADIRATAYQQIGQKIQFTVEFSESKTAPLTITLNLPGKHNACNALAALAVALEEGVEYDSILRGFKQFEGIGRRFHLRESLPVKQGHVHFIDDYGHHPREVNATVNAIRLGWPKQRLVLVFQPHRYSRTQDLFDDFVQVLSMVDVLIILPVFSAGEEPLVGAHTSDLCRSIRLRKQIVPIVAEPGDDLINTLTHVLRDNDILLMQGAGSIGRIAASIMNGEVNLCGDKVDA